jgi:uncharacterized BrkB/YihY/UPF0761 family membrane protein
MIENKRWARQKATPGDAAVEGLFSGFGVGLMMGLFLLIAGILTGSSITTVLSKLAARDMASPLNGVVTHVAVSGVYGVLFGALCHWIPQRWFRRLPNWLIGLAYGLLLWLIARVVFRAEIDAPMHALPALHLALAHLLYGLVLGLRFGKENG